MQLKDSPEFLEWFHINLGRGCSIDSLRKILNEKKFEDESIDFEFENYNNNREQINFTILANVNITKPDTEFKVAKVLTNKLQLYLVDQFMNKEECDGLIKLSNSILRPSQITRPSPDKDFRTSQSADIGTLKDPLVIEIDNRICKCLGIEKSKSEGTQIQRYDPTQQFKHHTDYFKKESGEYEDHAKHRGNRTWTFMVYLSDVEEGGGTNFKKIDYTIIPKAGNAVVWNNYHPDGKVNPNTLHAGLPIVKGQKYVITKWFRER
jgi:prolyl 4-hydroxylase